MKLSLSTLALIAAAVAQPVRRTIRGVRSIAGALRVEGRIAVSSAMRSAWRQPAAWAASVIGTHNTCRRPGRIRSGAIRIHFEPFVGWAERSEAHA